MLHPDRGESDDGVRVSREVGLSEVVDSDGVRNLHQDVILAENMPVGQLRLSLTLAHDVTYVGVFDKAMVENHLIQASANKWLELFPCAAIEVGLACEACEAQYLQSVWGQWWLRGQLEGGHGCGDGRSN